VEWTWDPDKAEENRRRHRISFKAAILALEDPLCVSESDWHPDGDRFRTFGRAGPLLLLVIHTWPERPPGRIISAREATPHERRRYEAGH